MGRLLDIVDDKTKARQTSSSDIQKYDINDVNDKTQPKAPTFSHLDRFFRTSQALSAPLEETDTYDINDINDKTPPPFGRLNRLCRSPLETALASLERRCPDHIEAADWQYAVEDGRRFLMQWGERRPLSNGQSPTFSVSLKCLVSNALPAPKMFGLDPAGIVLVNSHKIESQLRKPVRGVANSAYATRLVPQNRTAVPSAKDRWPLAVVKKPCFLPVFLLHFQRQV